MTILALDLGTHCGYACSNNQSGTWTLKPKTTESAGIRYVKFNEYLSTFMRLNKVTFVVYEEVHAHAAVDAAHVFGAMQGILQLVCINRGIEYKGVGVGTIKKHATGNGHSKKDAMVASASLKFKSVNVVDDNHADALWLLDYAINTIPRTTSN